MQESVCKNGQDNVCCLSGFHMAPLGILEAHAAPQPTVLTPAMLTAFLHGDLGAMTQVEGGAAHDPEVSWELPFHARS